MFETKAESSSVFTFPLLLNVSSHVKRRERMPRNHEVLNAPRQMPKARQNVLRIRPAHPLSRLLIIACPEAHWGMGGEGGESE